MRLLTLVALCCCLGCAPTRATFEETAPGGLSRRLVVSSFAIWPATASIAKQRASMGKTFSFGAEGVELDGGGTNLTESLRETTRLINALKP
jgi:hypothetical protein